MTTKIPFTNDKPDCKAQDWKLEDIISTIDDMIKTEKGCMKEDKYEEQIMEHQFCIEGLERLKKKLKESK